MRILPAVITAAGLLFAVQYSGVAPAPVQADPAREADVPRPDARNVVLAVHGGAGSGLIRKDTPPEL